MAAMRFPAIAMLLARKAKEIGKGAFSTSGINKIYCEAQTKPQGWEDGRQDGTILHMVAELFLLGGDNKQESKCSCSLILSLQNKGLIK